MANSVEVLLVEDNANDAEMAMRALEKNRVNAVVHRAKDGVEALQFLFEGIDRARPISLKMVLLDIKLPKVDGIEVLRRLKCDSVMKVIPVVILSSSDELKDRQATYGLGVNSFVVKPVDFEEFVRAMGQIGEYWLRLNRPPA